jgi:hypothetical protein
MNYGDMMTFTQNLDSPQVYWYGERGIVNAAIAHLMRSGKVIERVKLLLNAVFWADAKQPAWIADVAKVSLIVEVGLADFGDPDLIVVCETQKNKQFLVFLEAKVGSYTDSMQSTSHCGPARWGMEQEGFNSSINGQLTLKYRFAKALSRWDGDALSIAESPALFDAYRTRINDKKAPGRSLSKPSILKNIFHKLGLAQLPEENCYYVALTWDCASKRFLTSELVPAEYLPLFLNESGEDQFKYMMSRVGWIGYGELEHALGLEDAIEYKAAFNTMRDSVEPSLLFYREKKSTGRWEAFASSVRALAEQLAAALHAERLQLLPGSFSVKDENGLTIVKVIPNPDSVFVGVRDPYEYLAQAQLLLGESGINCRVKNVTFVGINVNSLIEAAGFIESIRTCLENPVLPASDTSSEPEI